MKLKIYFQETSKHFSCSMIEKLLTGRSRRILRNDFYNFNLIIMMNGFGSRNNSRINLKGNEFSIFPKKDKILLITTFYKLLY